MKDLVNKILYSGTVNTQNPHLQRRILFSNVIFLTLPVVYFAYMLLDIQVYIRPIGNMNIDQLTVPVMIVYCVICIFLNKMGLSYLSRVTFLIVWPLLMHIIPIIVLQTPADYYLAYPLGLVFHTVLVQLTISSKKEPFTFYTLIAASLIMVVFSRSFMLHFDANPDRISNEIVGTEYYALVAILYWLLFNTITFYVIKVLDEVIEKNEEQQELLDDVNKSLEKQVLARTKELKEANEMLTNYAFYNAHMIKGPFCRIKGLVMLNDKKAILENEFTEKLGYSINELDEAIAAMQEHLNAADKK